MKICNIKINDSVHFGLVTGAGIFDAQAAGYDITTEQVIAGADISDFISLCESGRLKPVENPVFANIVNTPVKLVCVGLNYQSHADGAKMGKFDCPVLFSKFYDSLAASGEAITLPEWETSYDYEAELVIVIGKRARNISEAEAESYIYGYTCGNDLSCRVPQKRTSQWLVGKAMPGFGPCGPYITTSDSIKPERGVSIKSYVNGEIRQDGTTSDMIFSCKEIVSYASKYICLNPGDLIFTGTPSGVLLEKMDSNPEWLKPGDRVDIEIEGIGTLSNSFI